MCGGDAESEGDGVEGDPAGLGVKSSGGDPRRSGVANEDQRGDARGVQQEDGGDSGGNENQCVREAAFAPEEP